MKLISTLLFVCAFVFVQAQCPAGNITLSTQAEVDNFVLSYPACSMLNANLTISSGPSNLDGLLPITAIAGNLTITNNDNLLNLSGLDNLTSTGGRVYIRSNDNINDISALANLQTVGTDLFFELLPALTNLNGLNNVTSVGARLYIRNNTSLNDISALSSVETVGSDLFFELLPMLANFDGLNNITSVGNRLYIRNNDLLTDISALSNVQSVGDDLFIEGNLLLPTLDGLQNIASVGDRLYIRLNDALYDIQAIAGVDASTISSLTISINPSLCFCSFQSICDYLVDPLSTNSISNNFAGGACTDRATVETACANLPDFPAECTPFLSIDWTEPLLAKVQQKDILLTWGTNNSMEQQEFIIETSADGKNFSVLSKLDPVQAEEGNTFYSFLYKDPNPGQHYFRIHQINLDGVFEYSDLASAYMQVNYFSIYGNLIQNKTTVFSKNKTQIQILNTVGIVMETLEIPEGNSSLELSHLAAGLYFIRTEKNELISFVKL